MFSDMQDKLRSVGIAPIFFVGSGISRRYIESPDWMGLLAEIVKDRDINFTKVVQGHTDSDNNINLEKLAQELEDIYFAKLADDEIEDGGNKPYYFRKKIANIMSKYLDERKVILSNNPEIIELKKTRPSAIITTNYDELLENVFGNDYSVHIGQDSLLGSVLDGVGEIYKIHGCITKPNSIVITEKDYNEFFNKNHYLNAKLLTLFLEYPIIFLGYSVSDRNIKSILSTIIEMLSPEKVEELKSRMWFVEMNAENTKNTVRINLEDGRFMDINSFALSDYGKLYSAINDISIKRLPIKFLKFLKANVYELVSSQEYNPKLLDVNIQDLEKIDDFKNTSEFVGLTFSTKKKIMFCDRDSICKAFINEDDISIYDTKSIIANKNSNSPKIPFYKFLVGLKMSDILKYIEEIGGKDSSFYVTMKDDEINYSLNLGNLKSVHYEGIINKQELEKYVDGFVANNALHKYQRGSVMKYVLLELLNSNINVFLQEEFLINDYRKEIIAAMTNLSDEFSKCFKR